jgi:hypothetical protein
MGNIILTIVALALPAILLFGAFWSLLLPVPKQQPSRRLRLGVALALYALLTVTWCLCPLCHPYNLIVDWRDAAFWPVWPAWTVWRDDIVDERGGMTVFELLLNLLFSALPFLLIGFGVCLKRGRWLPFILVGVLFLHICGCSYALRGM